MLAFVVAGAVTLGGIGLYQATRSNGSGGGGAVGPGGSRVTIEHAQGTRDNDDLAVVNIEVLVEFGDQDAASAAQFKPTVRCIMGSSDRTFTGALADVPGGGSSRSVRVQATIAPGAAAHEIEGQYDVTCALLLGDGVVARSGAVGVTIPSPNHPAATLAGDYATTLAPEPAPAPACVEYEYPPLRVDQSSWSSVAFTFTGVGGPFASSLGADLSFSFDAGSLGTFEGQFFVNEVQSVRIEGMVERTTPAGPCTFRFTADRRPEAPTTTT